MKMYLPSSVVSAYVNLNKTEHIDIYKYIAKPPVVIGCWGYGNVILMFHSLPSPQVPSSLPICLLSSYTISLSKVI